MPAFVGGGRVGGPGVSITTRGPVGGRTAGPGISGSPTALRQGYAADNASYSTNRLNPSRKSSGGSTPNPNATANADGLATLLKSLGPTAGTQAAALKPYESNTQINPQQKQAFDLTKGAVSNAQGAQGQMQTFADSLADKSNTNITNAMQRGRDATAVQLSDVRSGAGARGGGPGSGLSSLLQTRAAMSGNRAVQGLNADLTEKALGAEQSAREGVIRGASGVTGATSAASQAAALAAQDQRERDQNSADIWKFSNNFELEKAKAQNDQNNTITKLGFQFMNPWTGE